MTMERIFEWANGIKWISAVIKDNVLTITVDDFAGFDSRGGERYHNIPEEFDDLEEWLDENCLDSDGWECDYWYEFDGFEVRMIYTSADI